MKGSYSALEASCSGAHFKSRTLLHVRVIDVGEIGFIARSFFVASFGVEVFAFLVLLAVSLGSGCSNCTEGGVVVIALGILNLLEVHSLLIIKPIANGYFQFQLEFWSTYMS